MFDDETSLVKLYMIFTRNKELSKSYIDEAKKRYFYLKNIKKPGVRTFYPNKKIKVTIESYRPKPHSYIEYLRNSEYSDMVKRDYVKLHQVK